MKKLYSAAALAFAVSASALAATPVAEKVSLSTIDGILSETEMTVLSKSAKVAPMKVATPIEDIEGVYEVEYIYPFTSGSATKTSAKIEMVDDDQVVITMEPWMNGYTNITMSGLLAHYDAATGTITIKCEDNANLGTYEDKTDGTFDLEFRAQQLIPIPGDPEGKGEWNLIEELKGVVDANGTITFGDDDTMFGFGLIGMPTSWVGAFRGAKFVAPNYFTFKAEEWVNAGSAEFTEDWMNRWLKGTEDEKYMLPTRNIPLMRNKANPSMFLVENPFKANNWLNEDPKTDGYLVFSLENYNVVPMLTLVPSGLWVTLEQGGFPEELYLYNQAGYLVYSMDKTLEESLSMLRDNDLTPSNFNPETKTVTLRNLLFGYSSEPLGVYSFTNIVEGLYTIKADGFAGVNSVFDDSENAPKRFFNLQGIEVANPAAGELVIVKQGNKTSKTIIR